MFLACGVGAFTAAIFHVITHAFFKALLFLGSGSVIHGMHHEQDMRRMGGLRKYMPITFATMMTGWLAISGIPIFAGFFSKDEILWKTWSAGGFSLPSPIWSKALWLVAAITALLTAVYMTRMMVMTFWGPERFRERQDDHHDEGDPAHVRHTVHGPQESPWVMTVPLIVLAVLSTLGGFIGVPYALGSLFSEHPVNYIEETLKPAITNVPSNVSHGEGTHVADDIQWNSPKPQQVDGPPAIHALEGPAVAGAAHVHSPEEIRAERLLALLSVLIAAFGIGVGWVIFQKRPLLQMPRILEQKYYVDEIYEVTIIKPIEVVSREGLWKIFDVGVIDGFLHALGDAVTEGGRLIRHMQGGFVRSYATIILIGALVLIGFFAYFGADAWRLAR
jgi:NADH-quinone oxidoreductase subunit L